MYLSRERCRVQCWALMLLVAVILLGKPTGFARAQNVNAGEIRGSVSDSTGAAVPGVAVSIVNINTGVRTEVVTNDAGVYDALSLLPGQYTLTFTKEGFNRHVRQGIDLGVQVITVNQEMAIGATSQSVEVSANASLLRTENSEQGATLTAAVMKELPNVGQNWLSFTKTLPGVTGSNEGVSVNGGQRYQGNWLSDGGLVVIPRSQNLDSPVIFESIAEVKITTATFDAQYGSGTAVFNQITKSGTNEFHGSLYEYAQNSAFNARSFFAQRVAHQRRHQYGGSVGGPIRRDKLFFYLNYDVTSNRSSNPGFSTRPTAAMKAGDFSDPAFPTIYDPNSLQMVNGQMVRQPFPGNRIPQSSLDPVALKIQEYFPTANLPGYFQNFYFEPLNASKPWMFLIKGDYAISNSNRLNASFMRRKQVVTPDARFAATFPLDTNAGDTGGLQGQVSDVWTISPTTVNEFRTSVVRQAIRNVPTTLGQGYIDRLGIKYAVADLFPTVNIGGPVGSTNVGPGTSAVLGATSFVTANTVTVVKGKHIIKGGGQWEASQDNGGNWGDVSAASFTFNPVFTTRAPFDTASGLGYADFLTGKVSSWSAFVSPPVGVRMKTGQFFFQDDIKLRPNLTINMGLRWEIQGGWSEVNNRIAAFDPTLTNPATNTPGAMWFAGDNGRRTLQDTVKKTFLPRFGFAYTPTQRWSVRGGYGIFSHRWGTDTYAVSVVRNTTGFFTTGSLTQTDSVNPVFQLSDPNPKLNTYYPDPSKRTPASLNGQPVQYFPFDTPVSKLHEWSVSIQRELPQSMVAEVSYVGTKGSKLYFPRDLNQVPENLLGPGNAQTRRPYPQYQAIGAALFDGASSYNSLQAQLRKRFSAGVSFDMNYTWSKNLNHYDASGHSGQTGQNYYQNAYDRDVHWGLSNNDIPHAFKTNFVAQLPFGRGRKFLDSNGWADAVLGGWQVSGILIRQSGIPFTPIVAGANQSGSLAGTWFPNRIGSGKAEDPTLSRWFDPSAFVAPAAFTFGNSGRNILRGPKLLTLDASMGKNFSFARLREGMQLQLRVDATNIMNHAVFGLPNASIGGNGVGVITSTAVGGRTLQLGARFAF